MPDANMFVERRANPRVSVKVPIQYRIVKGQEEIQGVVEWREKDQTAKTMDLSLGGMQIVMDQKPLLGSVMCFDIMLPNSRKLSSVFAEVVWMNDMGAGLHFIMIRNEDLEALQNYLDGEFVKQNTSEPSL